MSPKTSPTVEAVKEGLRVAALGALGVVVDALTTNSFSWRLTGIAAGVAALRALDKWIHLSDKTSLKGLLPW